jgi:serum/glucocorticoid-regulated kinase 2
LYELLVGCPPFYDPDLSEYETKKNIAYAEVEFPEDYGLSNEVKELIEKLLVKNPNQRLGHFAGAKEIMLHPWVGKINRAFIESKSFQVPFPPNLDRFNFDPDEVGMSEERFTTKIEEEYRTLNVRRAIHTKKEKR